LRMTVRLLFTETTASSRACTAMIAVPSRLAGVNPPAGEIPAADNAAENRPLWRLSKFHTPPPPSDEPIS
jgi:hypothetical protein